MAKTVIRSRINSAVKQEAQALLDKFCLTMSEAIRLFLYQVVLEKGLPFQVKLSADAARPSLANGFRFGVWYYGTDTPSLACCGLFFL